MIVDVHAHLWGTHPEEDKRKILQVAEQFSVDKVMISTLQTYSSRLRRRSGRITSLPGAL